MPTASRPDAAREHEERYVQQLSLALQSDVLALLGKHALGQPDTPRSGRLIVVHALVNLTCILMTTLVNLDRDLLPPCQRLTEQLHLYVSGLGTPVQ